jgi:hypothetical protein
MEMDLRFIVKNLLVRISLPLIDLDLTRNVKDQDVLFFVYI